MGGPGVNTQIHTNTVESIALYWTKTEFNTHQ